VSRPPAFVTGNITIVQAAEICGLAKSTIRRAFWEKKPLFPETAEIIEEKLKLKEGTILRMSNVKGVKPLRDDGKWIQERKAINNAIRERMMGR
jgi:hypothetical protein